MRECSKKKKKEFKDNVRAIIFKETNIFKYFISLRFIKNLLKTL